MTSKRWRWMPGMLAVRVRDSWHIPPTESPRIGRKVRVLRVADRPDGRGRWVCCDGDTFDAAGDDYEPDLTDAATLGCLLALVREAWGAPAAYCAVHPNATAKPWRVFGIGDGVGPGGDTEGEALVRALEAAP